MFNSFLQWSTVAVLQLQFAFTGFIYLQYNAKNPQMDLRWAEKGNYKNFFVKDIIFTNVFKPSSQLFSLCQYLKSCMDVLFAIFWRWLSSVSSQSTEEKASGARPTKTHHRRNVRVSGVM